MDANDRFPGQPYLVYIHGDIVQRTDGRKYHHIFHVCEQTELTLWRFPDCVHSLN